MTAKVELWRVANVFPVITHGFCGATNGSMVYVLGERDGSITALDYEASTGQLREKQRVTALPPGFQGAQYCGIPMMKWSWMPL